MPSQGSFNTSSLFKGGQKIFGNRSRTQTEHQDEPTPPPTKEVDTIVPSFQDTSDPRPVAPHQQQLPNSADSSEGGERLPNIDPLRQWTDVSMKQLSQSNENKWIGYALLGLSGSILALYLIYKVTH